jgi:hypothetical protein
MPTIHVNDIQAWKLFQFMQTQGKGAPHLRRMQRLRQTLDIDKIEDLFEHNQDVVESFQADGKAAPKSKLAVLRAEDPTHPAAVDLGDLDKIHSRVIAAWDREVEPEPGKEVDPICGACGRTRETQDDRIYLPLLETIKAAWTEVEAQKGTSKSVEPAPASSNGEKTNAAEVA